MEERSDLIVRHSAGFELSIIAMPICLDALRNGKMYYIRAVL
jgi:methyl coenzyme M reductase beta subunit